MHQYRLNLVLKVALNQNLSIADNIMIELIKSKTEFIVEFLKSKNQIFEPLK